jgi:hypothetical protein
MKKAKAKPIKGSARTKKFDAGGLAALAGLGTLAYLMSRKKKGDEGGKFEDLKSVEKTKTLKEQIGRDAEAPAMSAEVKRAMAASKGRPELIPEGADEAAMRSDVGLKRTMPAAKKATAGGSARTAAKMVADKVMEKAATQSFPVSTAGKANVDLPSKPYPKGVKGTTTDPYLRPSLGLGLDERQQARKDFLSRRAAEAKERMDAEEKARAARRKGVADTEYDTMGNPIMKRGGKVKKYASGGSVSSASKRADGIAQRGKTKGRIC